MRTAPVDGVRSTLQNFRLGGLAERAKATPVLCTYDGDTKYQLGNLKSVISEHCLRIKFLSSSCEIDLRWMPQNTFDDKSTLVWAMAWHHKATGHYLSQCWTRYIVPYGVSYIRGLMVPLIVITRMYFKILFFVEWGSSVSQLSMSTIDMRLISGFLRHWRGGPFHCPDQRHFVPNDIICIWTWRALPHTARSQPCHWEVTG